MNKKLKKKDRLYQLDIPLIGITGSVGTGKTTVTNYLKEKGQPCIDADKLVKAIYEKSESKEFIRELNPCFFLSDGKIDFKKLRESFFEEPDLKKRIENYIYQRLPDQFFKAFKKLKSAALLFYDVPLLFEKKLEDRFDFVATVSCGQEEQLRRVMARDHLSLEAAQKLIASQIDIEYKSAKSDYSLHNDSDLQSLYCSVDKFLSLVEESFLLQIE